MIMTLIGLSLVGIIGKGSWMNIVNELNTIDTNLLNFFSIPRIAIAGLLGIGLVLASVFAAIMSTADSQLLVGASSNVRDIYEKIIHKNHTISQKYSTFLSRLVVFSLIVIAIILGLLIKDEILWFVLFAWAGLGAAIVPTSILSFLSLFWEKTTKHGIFAGLISGTFIQYLTM